MHRGMAGVCVLAAVGALALAAVAGPVAAAEVPDNSTERAGNASLGTEISSFMQASSAEARRGVEDGRFDAAMNRTADETARRALIEERLARLEARQEQLRTRREALGKTPDVRNRSIATRVAVGAAGLERSLEGTERAAVEAGVNDERLAELRSNAGAMTGPEVAELARGLAGPPNDVGGPSKGDRTEPPESGAPPEASGPDDRPSAGTPEGTASASPASGRSAPGAPANGRLPERGGSANGTASDPGVGNEPPDDTPENGPPDDTGDRPSEDAPGNGAPANASDAAPDGPEDETPADASGDTPDGGSDASGARASDGASGPPGPDSGPGASGPDPNDSNPDGSSGGRGIPDGNDGDTDESRSGVGGGAPGSR